MRVAVLGAGAVGCYYGGMLARAGHEVTLIGRATHVEAVKRSGLRLETRSFNESLQVNASEDPGAVKGAELVLFCVKSPDTESAGKAMKDSLAKDTVILSLQNGVDNAERLAAVLGREVIPAVVYVATEMAGPGHVRHHGRGELVIGESAAGERVAKVLRAAGVPVEVSDNVAGALWAKLVVNCAYNAFSAIAQLPYGQLVSVPGIAPRMRAVVDECLAVARASGVQVPGDMHDAVQRIAQTMPGQRSSTAQDLERGKPTEIEHLNGVVVKKGDALGIATPVNRTLLELVRALEARGRA